MACIPVPEAKCVETIIYDEYGGPLRFINADACFTRPNPGLGSRKIDWRDKTIHLDSNPNGCKKFMLYIR